MNVIKQENNCILYRCPKCFLIPLIKIYLDNGNSYIDKKCCEVINKILINDFISKYQLNINKCSHIINEDNSYICYNCKLLICDNCKIKHENEFNIHIIYKSVIFDTYCLIHNELFIGYCNLCENNICKNCINIHKNHNYIIFNDILLTEEQIIEIEKNLIIARNNMEKLYKFKEIIIQKINDKSFKEKIESSSIYFKKRNNNLYLILSNIISSYSHFKKSLNYQMISNLQINSNLNLKEIKINLSLYQNTNDLIREYLKQLFLYSIIKNPISKNHILLKNSHLELSKMKTIKILKDHTSGITCLYNLKDKRFSSGSYDGYIILYQYQTFKPQFKIFAHSNWVLSLNQLKNEYLISSSRDTTYKIWEIGLKNYRLISTIKGHSGCTDSFLELSNNNYASCSFDKTIKIWNKNPKWEFYCIKTLEFKEPIKRVIEIQNCLVNNVFDHTIHFTLISNYEEICVITNIDCWSSFSMIKLNNEKFIVGGFKFLFLINAVSKQLESKIYAHEDIIWCIYLTKKGFILTGGSDKNIKLWDLINMKCISEKKNAEKKTIVNLIELPDGRIATNALEERIIKIWQ